MYLRLRTLTVLLLMLVLPLQALVSVTPSLLLPHSHQTTASTAVCEHHAHHHSSYGVAEQPSPGDHHGNSVSSHDHHGLSDDCCCAWCIACPIPVAMSSLLDNLSASLYAPITSHFLHYIPDLLQPPPRV